MTYYTQIGHTQIGYNYMSGANPCEAGMSVAHSMVTRGHIQQLSNKLSTTAGTTLTEYFAHAQ